MDAEITEAAKQKNHSFFYVAAAEIGLHRPYKSPFDDPLVLTLTGGSKRTTKVMANPAPRRTNPPQAVNAVKKVLTLPATLRGWHTMPTCIPLPRSADPSPTPPPRKSPPHPVTALGQTPDEGQTSQAWIATQAQTAMQVQMIMGNTDTGAPNNIEILMRVIQQAMAPVITRLDALE